jgi:CRISPR-associated endonuclease Cas1
MRSQCTTATITPNNGVAVLSGYGIRVAVDRGYLVVEDGIGPERRTARFSRASRVLRRLVVIGHTGFITFDALRWLHDVGGAFVQIDADGLVIAATAPAGTDDVRLRRAQAMAALHGTDLTIARMLLAAKLAGQAEIVERLQDRLRDVQPAHEIITTALAALAQAATIDELRAVEAQAAAVYWGAWASLPVRFARRDADRIPTHWHTFGTRSSPLTGSPRRAVNPANALLNYLYAILEAEARIASLAVGLDPGMGFLHRDLRARDSLACDLMEAVRPKVDGVVLDLLYNHHFAASDFFETRQGVCRLMPSLTVRLAELALTFARWIAPVTERVAEALARSGRHPAKYDVPTPLTQSNRSAGRGGLRRTAKRPSGEPAAHLPPACLQCGTMLDTPHRQYCDACLPEYRAEAAAALSQIGPAALAAMRAGGHDPAHGGEAGRKRGARNAAHQSAVARWDQENPGNAGDESFRRDVLPGLQAVPLRAMAEATGLTEGYCSFIRRGIRVPHARHWETLARLGKQHSER